MATLEYDDATPPYPTRDEAPANAAGDRTPIYTLDQSRKPAIAIVRLRDGRDPIELQRACRQLRKQIETGGYKADLHRSLIATKAGRRALKKRLARKRLKRAVKQRHYWEGGGD